MLEKNSYTEGSQMPLPEKENSYGSVFGVIIIIILVIVGAVYFTKNIRDSFQKTESPASDSVMQNIDTAEKDLNNIEIDSLDSEIQNIDPEFESASSTE
jgi:hypothetical protein